jgi:hypothetical protein
MRWYGINREKPALLIVTRIDAKIKSKSKKSCKKAKQFFRSAQRQKNSPYSLGSDSTPCCIRHGHARPSFRIPSYYSTECGGGQASHRLHLGAA